jgi:phosphatidylethanolamine/phosphatidyl-N-methylethanolamine N-methyltransferase
LRSQPSRSNERGAPKSNMPLEERLADEARFFLSWLDNPLIAGAVSPSGRFLARMMARYVDPLDTAPIIELGPGTGAITEALLARGVAPERLHLVEFDENFCKLLKRRFPGINIIKGDAYSLTKTLGDRLDQPAASIVSSLPLLMKPEAQRLSLLGDAFDCMAPNGCFIQFTYGLVSPMPRDKAGPAFCVEGSPPVWLNLPPARVWIYRPKASENESVAQIRPSRGQDFLQKLKLGTEKIHLDLKREIEDARARLRLKSRAAQAGRKRLQPESALRISRKKPDVHQSRQP